VSGCAHAFVCILLSIVIVTLTPVESAPSLC